MKKAPDQPLQELADAAFKKAAKKVIEQAAESGTPVIVWENDAIQAVEPRKAQAPRTKKNGQTSRARRTRK